MKILDTFPEIVALGEGLVDAHPHAEDGRGGYDWETAAIGRERGALRRPRGPTG